MRSELLIPPLLLVLFVTISLASGFFLLFGILMAIIFGVAFYYLGLPGRG